jgi:DNA polymerase-3 subunit gamma/tau
MFSPPATGRRGRIALAAPLRRRTPPVGSPIVAEEPAPTDDDAARPHAGGDFVSLYRRFRPGKFAEVRGQAHVVRALQGAVRDDRVAHAYLFSGTRGTGKTSTARILARALNCAAPVDGEPCGVCTSCVEIARGSSFDVHELDAASNNGVDAMRELIAHAALATPGRWKVYIVDEVHMLSNAAANALLKTLEEPPGHVVFVLATTDPQKVPPTIRSRTQHLEFGLIGADTLEGLLHDVSAAAGLDLADDDIAVAVRRGRGSARDALSALDQVVASGSAEALRPDVVALTEAIASEDAREALVAIAALHESGWGPQQIANELVDDLRQAFLVALAPELCAAAGSERERLADQSGRLGLARVVRAIETVGRAQVDMRDAPDPRAVLEVTLVRLARPELDDSSAALLDRIAHLEQAVAGGALAAVRAATHQQPPAPRPPAGDRATRPGDRATRPADRATRPGDRATRPGDRSAPDAPGGPVAPLEERPSLGALRRRRTQTDAQPDAPRAGSPPGDRAGNEAGDDATASSTEPSTGAAPDRDRIVEAWGDHILRGLPARAKALFSAGRFLSVEGHTVTYALPNAAHRERCEDVRPLVERAIGAHFSTPIELALTVDESAGATPAADARLHPDDEVDPDRPSGTLESVAEARLLEAFPGAQEV